MATNWTPWDKPKALPASSPPSSNPQLNAVAPTGPVPTASGVPLYQENLANPQHNVQDPGTQVGAMNALMNPSLQAAGSAFQAAGQTATGDDLFQAMLASASSAHEQANRDVLATLEAAGLSSSGAGFAQNSPYANLQDQWQKNLLNMAMQANIQAPQLAIQNYGNATGLAQGLYGQMQGTASADAQRQYQAQLDAWNMAQQSNSGNADLYAGLGSALLGTAGTVAGAMFGGPPGAMVGGGIGSGLSGLLGGGGVPGFEAGGGMGVPQTMANTGAGAFSGLNLGGGMLGGI